MTKEPRPNVEFVSDKDELDPKSEEALKRFCDDDDLHSNKAQSRMMATAVFLLLTDERVKLESRKDIMNAWNMFVTVESEMTALERYMEVCSKIPEKLKELPEELRLLVVLDRLSKRVSSAWTVLHNLVTVMNPTKEEQETDPNGNPIEKKP